MRWFGLTAVLFVVWLALSGYFQPLLLIMGLVCSILVAFLAARMRLMEAPWPPALQGMHRAILFSGRDGPHVRAGQVRDQPAPQGDGHGRRIHLAPLRR